MKIEFQGFVNTCTGAVQVFTKLTPQPDKYEKGNKIMNLTTNRALKVPFYGDTLYLVEHQGEPYTPMKPIVEAIGMDWASQFSKIKDNFGRWNVVFIPMVAQDKKRREMLCLPIRKLLGWMMTISPNRVKPEIREKVIQYQNECDDILWEYWSEKNILFQAINTQAANKIISLNHLETICEYRRSSAAILYFFLKNENSDLAEERWFKLTCRELGQFIGFAHTGVGVALNYLYKSDLIFKDTEVGHRYPYYYQINHRILNQKLRQQGLPSINKKTIN